MPGWAKHLTQIVEWVSNLLEERDDSDSDWRCRFLQVLATCLIDAEKKPEGAKMLDKLNDITKKFGGSSF